MKITGIITLLLILNLAAHFMPFERAALAPDDYASLVRLKSMESGKQSPTAYADRPLNYAVLFLQSKLIGDNVKPALVLLFLSASALLIAVYFLLLKLLRDPLAAFAGSVIFCLIPNKLETYHTLIYFNMNVVFLLYLLSLIYFVGYAEKGKVRLLILSTVFYGIGIFWYEVGFFAPVLMLAYCLIEKKGRLASIVPHSIVALIYTAYRLSGAFGFAGQEGYSHSVSFSMLSVNLMDLFHHYAGRYLLRSAVYGGYNFITMQISWLIAISALLLVVLYLVNNSIRKSELSPRRTETLTLGVIAFLIFVLPILFNDKGGVGGRHLVLPSLGISIICVWVLQSVKFNWRRVFLAAVAVLIVISAGNNWIQVIACRINGAVYGYLERNETVVREASAVVIDTKSFADKIPYTFIERDFNVLNTYFGAQTFEDWGLVGMVRWLTDDPGKPVYAAVTRPVERGKSGLEFCVFKYMGYRSKSEVLMILPAGNNFIVNFDKVFGGKFNYGLGANHRKTI